MRNGGLQRTNSQKVAKNKLSFAGWKAFGRGSFPVLPSQPGGETGIRAASLSVSSSPSGKSKKSKER